MNNRTVVDFTPLIKELGALRADAKRIDWLERKHTLHDSVEILYVVDGYNVDIMTNDGSTCVSTSHGETLRDAIDAAMRVSP